MKREHNFGIYGFIAGAAVGAALGILLAPRSGKDTRRDIKHRVKKAREGFDEMVEKLKSKMGNAADAAEEVGAKAKKAADNVRHTAN